MIQLNVMEKLIPDAVARRPCLPVDFLLFTLGQLRGGRNNVLVGRFGHGRQEEVLEGALKWEISFDSISS